MAFRALLWDKGDSLPRTWVQKGSHRQKLIKAAQRGALFAKEGNKNFPKHSETTNQKKKKNPNGSEIFFFLLVSDLLLLMSMLGTGLVSLF